MKVIDKDNKDDSAVHLPWDAAQAALASGNFELAERTGERGPDQPAAQSPAPGVDPIDDTLQTRDYDKTPNMTGVAGTPASPGLARSEPVPAPVKAPEPAPAAPKAAVPAPAPGPAPVAPTAPAKPV